MSKFNFKINRGIVLNNEFLVFNFFVSHYIFFLNYFFKNYPRETILKIYEISCLSDVFILCESSKKKSKNFNEILLNFIEDLNHLGFSELEIFFISDKKFKIVSKKPHLSKSYKQIFGNDEDQHLELIYLVVLKNFFKCYFNKRVKANSIVSPNLIEFDFCVLDEDFNYEFDGNYPEFETGNISKKLFNILLNDKVNYNEGNLLFCGMRFVNLPYYTLFNILNFSNYDKKFCDFFINFGYLTGISFVNIYLNYDNEIGDEIYEAILNTFDISGFGRIELIGGCKKHIKLENSFLKNIKKYYSEEVIDLFFRFVANCYRGIYDKSYNVSSEIKYLENFSFELVEIPYVELCEEDELIVNGLSYKSLLL